MQPLMRRLFGGPDTGSDANYMFAPPADAVGMLRRTSQLGQPTMPNTTDPQALYAQQLQNAYAQRWGNRQIASPMPAPYHAPSYQDTLAMRQNDLQNGMTRKYGPQSASALTSQINDETARYNQRYNATLPSIPKPVIAGM